jgi:hypothetical protein
MNDDNFVKKIDKTKLYSIMTRPDYSPVAQFNIAKDGHEQ